MNIKKILIASAGSAIILGCVAVSAFAVSIVNNGSFETGIFTAQPFDTLVAGNPSIDNWSVDSGSIDWIGSYWQSSNGSRNIDMNGLEPGKISQVLTTVAGAVYNVTFDMSGNPDGGPALKTLDVDTGGAPSSFSYNTGVGNTHADMKWSPRSFSFTAASSSTTLTFTSTTLESPFGPALDNVVVEQSLPTIKDQCKKDGWKTFGVFKNQGDCVSFVATGGKNPPANQ